MTTTWSPAQLRAVELSADSGHIGRLADLCDTLLGDDRLQELFETRTGALLGSELTFEGSLRRKGTSAPRAQELDEDWWDAFPEDELSQFVVWGRLLGVSFGELVWTTNERTGRVTPRLKFWHPKHFSYDWEKQQWFLDLGLTNKLAIDERGGQWVIYAPFGRYRPWAHGLWRGISRWWMLKSYAILDWGVHSEKSSKLILSTTEQATAGQRKAVVAEVYEMAKDAVISLPLGYQLSLMELTANTNQIYNAQIDAANTAFAIAVLGQNLTTEVQGGSFAAAKTHLRVELQRARSDKETLSTTLRSQAIERWAEFNFGDRTAAPWPNWHIEPAEEQGSNATTLATLANALTQLKELGFTVDEETLREKYGVKLTQLTAADVDRVAALQPPPPEPPPESPQGDGTRAPQQRGRNAQG